MEILSAGSTNIGRVRNSNQDSIYLDKERNLYLVADGMGGHQGGDIASQMAVKLIPEYFFSHLKKNPIKTFGDSVNHANKEIYKVAQENPKLQGMGTTVVGLFYQNTTLYISNVGDSRAYLIRDNQLYQLSRDHSLVQEKINLGIYSRDQGAKDKMKNVLVRTVGYELEIDIDVFCYEFSKNDLFLICSDGLHGKVSDRDTIFLINKFIPDPSSTNAKTLEKTVECLIDQANANGGQDNISVILSMVK